MRCENARQLFDAYLDGELSGAMATEFAAHRVRCAACRRDLALLEVAGHVLATDPEAANAPVEFTDRLLACMDARSRSLPHRVARWAYVAGPLAAAAVILLAFLGVFDRRDNRVAGHKEVRLPHEAPAAVEPQRALPAGDAGIAREPQRGADATELLLDHTRKNLAVKRESAETIQQALDAAAQQWIDILERANSAAPDPDSVVEPGPIPGGESPVPKPPDDRPIDAP